MVPSSSGLGHGPLKAETRVRLSMGSPIQAAGIKTCRFSLFSKAFSEFECSFFENGVLGSFYELVYAKVFVFQCLEWVWISLGLWDTFLSFIRLEASLKEKFLRLTTNYFYSNSQAPETTAYGSGLPTATPILFGWGVPILRPTLAKIKND